MKHLVVLLALALLATAPPLFAQTLAWQSLEVPATTGQVKPLNIVADAAGHLFVGGSFSGTATFGASTIGSAGGTDAFVAKYDLNTNAWLWAVRAGGTSDDAATAVALGQGRSGVAGAVYVAGNFGGAASFGSFNLPNASGTDDAFVGRLNDAGPSASFAWVTPLASDFFDVVGGLAARGPNVYVAGSFYGTTLSTGAAGVTLANAGGPSGSADGFLVKLSDLNTAGTARWAQALAGPDSDFLTSVVVRGRDVFVGGSFQSTAFVAGLATLVSNGQDDAALARFTDFGTTNQLRWATSGGGAGVDYVTRLTANKTNLYAGGSFENSAAFGSTTLTGSGQTGFVARLPRTSAQGQFTWALGAGGTGTSSIRALFFRGLNLYAGGAATGTVVFGPASLSVGSGAVPFLAKLTDQTTAGLWRGAIAASTADGSLDAVVGSPGRGFYGVGTATPPAQFGGFSINTPVGSPTGYLVGIADVPPMNVTALSPARNAVAAPAAGPIQVTFDQAVNTTAGSANGVQVYASERGGYRNGPGQSSAGGNTVTFTPSLAFRAGEKVAVSITNDVQSTSGALAAPQVYNFRVAAGGTGRGRLRAAGSAVAAGNTPNAVVLADVNNDGKLDALSNTGNGSGVNIRQGDGAGHFVLPATNALRNTNGVSDQDLAVADLDGDGNLDLAFVNHLAGGNGLVGIRLNDNAGTGNFGNSGPDVPTNDLPTAVALADVNADGDLDLVYAAQTDAGGASAGTVGVRLGDGSGSFYITLADVPLGGLPTRVALADVNDDGYLDLLTANLNSTLSLRLGDGNGNFYLPVSGAEISLGSVPGRLAVGDVDNDGHVDLVSGPVGGSSAATLNVRLGDGTGFFTAAADVVLPTPLTDLALADFNADGNLDLAAATGSAVALRLGDGAGNFPAPAAGSNLGGTLAGAGALATGDIDNDGDLDAVVISATAGASLQALLNTPLVAPDLVVNLPGTSVAGGFYNNVTVTSTGTGSLAADISVDGALSIQSGGTLDDNCHVISGAGSFTLASGGSLRICSTAGISSTGTASGTVQVTGTRTYSRFASYAYTSQSAAAVSVGNGLPTQVRDLSVNTGTGPLGLAGPLAVRRALTFATAGTLQGGSLTLLSDPDSTALVVNSGTGTYTGSAAAQRAVSRGSYQGVGYRHYAAPVSGATVGSLAVAGVFTPDVSQGSAYNTSATPGMVTPFPTVFGYDQSRLTTSPATTYSNFDKGWVAPTSVADPLTPGRGYTVNIPATTVTFTGPLTTGDRAPQALARTTGPTAADGGWALVGNPYPAPLDWSLVAPTDRNGLDGAIAVFAPSSQYGGTYRSYVNGMGGNPVLPLGQGFFVRVSTGNTSGSLTFRNAQRRTSFDATAFRRGTADSRPMVTLSLQAPGSLADELTVYAQAGASAGFDREFDAAKLPNSTGLNLAAVAASGEPLAIQGLPLLNTTTVVPLTLGVPAAGTYTLRAAALANLPAGTTLTDALTGQRLNLAALSATGYTFSVSAAQAAAPITGRFFLNLGAAAGALATTAAALNAVSLYPNPAHGQATVLLPAGPATLVLTDALGRVVQTQAASGSAVLDVSGLPAGVYALRVQTAAGQVVRRLVVE